MGAPSAKALLRAAGAAPGFIVRDGHGGLAAARLAVFGGGPGPRGPFHLQSRRRGTPAYAPRLAPRADGARAIRRVFDSPSRPAAQLRLKEIVPLRAQNAPQLALGLEENLRPRPDGVHPAPGPPETDAPRPRVGAGEPGTPTPHPRAPRFSQGTIPPAPQHGAPGRNQRRMGNRNPPPQPATPNPALRLRLNKFTEKKLRGREASRASILP